MTKFVINSNDKSPRFSFVVKPANGNFNPWDNVATFGYFVGDNLNGLSNPYCIDYYKAKWIVTVPKRNVDRLFDWAKSNNYRLILL